MTEELIFLDGYVRIWMEVDPKNKLFYIGYVLIGASSAVLMGMKIRYGKDAPSFVAE